MDVFLHSGELFRYTQWFFTLPTDVRMSLARNAWNSKNGNRYRGYYPIVPGVPCHKEVIEFVQELPPEEPDLLSLSGNYYAHEPNMWPPEVLPGAAEFKTFVLSYLQTMGEVSSEIVHLLASGLGKDEIYFDKLLSKPLNPLRLIHYPPRQVPEPNAARKDGLVLTCLEHTDTNFVTLLSTFCYKGLQILQHDGSWADVEVGPDCLVMNAGDALVKATGRFKATRHRVIDHGEDRYSVPFFVEPNYYAEIGRYEKENPPQSVEAVTKFTEDEPMQYGPWAIKRMKEKNFTDLPT